MLSALRAITPNAFDDEASLLAASTCWHPLWVKTRPTRFKVVVRPETEEEAHAVLALSAENGWSVRAVGGGSGTAEPPTASIGLDTSRLSSVALSEADLTVVAGAGVTVEALEEDLNRHGYTLGQHLGSARLATVGGCVETGAFGPFSGRYGGFAAICRSTERVQSVTLSATLAIRPAPEVRAWAVFSAENDADALDALRLIYRSDARPSLARYEDGKVILAFEGDELVQTGHYQLAHAICQQVGLAPRDESEGEAWLESLSRDALWSRNAQEGVWADQVNLSLPWSRLGAALAQVRTLQGRPSLETRIVVLRPDAHGATLAIEFAAHTDEAGWRRRREELQAIGE
jgi:FAD/FMN-containing dehydrogenase